MTDSEPSAPVEVFSHGVEENIPVGIACFAGSAVAIGALLQLEDLGPFVEPTWEFTLGTVFNAHFVELGATRSGTRIVLDGEVGGGVLAASQFLTTVPSAVYHLVPIVSLVAGGVAAVRRSSVEVDMQGAAATGATIALGYLIAAAIALYALTIDSAAGVGVQSIVPLLIAGGIYPVVFGGLGGVLANELGV